MGRCIILMAGLIACTHATPPSPAAAPPPASVAAPTPTQAPDSGATATPVAAPPLAFYPVVTFGEWLGLHPLGGDTMMIAAGPKLIRVDPAGVVHDDRELTAGIVPPWPDFADTDDESKTVYLGDAGGWWTVQVGGTWPSAAFLTLATPMMQRAPDVYRWAGDRWRPARAANKHFVAYPQAIRPWKDGSLLAWRGVYARALDLDDQCSQCPDEMYETPKYKAAERAVAGAKLLAVVAGPAKAPSLSGRDVVAFDALASGEVFVVQRSGTLLVLDGGGKPRKIAATGAPEVRGLFARGAADVVAFGATAGAPYLARFDGTTMAPIVAPACAAPIASLSIAGSTWWATCGSAAPQTYEDLSSPDEIPASLWRREGDGAWTQVLVAPEFRPRVVWARGQDDVWLSALTDRRAVVLHSRDPGRVIVLGTTESIIANEFTAR